MPLAELEISSYTLAGKNDVYMVLGQHESVATLEQQVIWYVSGIHICGMLICYNTDCISLLTKIIL